MNLPGSISDALRRGAVVVAASPRAARTLRLQHGLSQREEGREVWPAPDIHDWDSWLRILWQNHAFADPDAPLALTGLQERALWTRVQQEDAGLVLSPDSMAALAMGGWERLSAYNAHAARRHSWEQSDAERFRLWSQEFDRECAARGWFSAAQFESQLAAVPLDRAGLPPEICLVGFDRFTPAQTRLLETFRERGVAVAEFEPEPIESQRFWIVADGRRDEIAVCAGWVRQMLLDHPHARIGIVVPDIAAVRGEMERAFRRALLPSADEIRRPSAMLPFEFSLGRPLAEVPAIRAALLVLRWIADPVSEEEISWLMLSGFVADTVTNQPALARHLLRRRGPGSLCPERPLGSFRASLAGQAGLRGLSDHLNALLQAVEGKQVLTQSRQPSGFAELVPLLLERLAWPGERSPDSVQYQAQQRWQRLLDDVALLDFDGSRCTYNEFLNLIERAARETVFSPESADAPVQILGPLESAGQQFDAIWFLSADDQHWPATGRLHPLLPASVQRQFGMPHAAIDDDWNLAHKVTARLLASAPQVVFSYARREQDAELRPSPILSGLFSAEALQSAGAQPPFPETRIAALEAIPDGERLLPWPRERHAGGADVLRRQAACAFQSFAAKRLAAEPLEASEWGFTAADRGVLLHRVLQRLFSQSLHTHEDLAAAMAAQQLPDILDRHIQDVFAELPAAENSGAWQQACIAAEKRRLHARLSEWLAVEAERQPFTVEGCEQKLQDVQVGELRLDLRADRIDRLPDGSRLLIDYKTGRVSPAAWKGDRPDEPQLPLYAVCGNLENVSGILFAKIRAGDTGFDGRVRDARAQLSAGISPRKALVAVPYTNAMREEWSRALHALAEEFLDGEREVAPREPEVCRLCSLHALCRVAELSLGPAGDEAADEESADA